MDNFIEREYREGLILVFIKEALNKLEEIDGKFVIKNVLKTDEINNVLNDSNLFKKYNSKVIKRLPGTNDYIVNKEALRMHFIDLINKKNDKYYSLSYQQELLEDFFHINSKKIGEGKNIKYPNEFSFEEEDYNNIEYIKILLLLDENNYIKINNINSGYIIPEDEKEEVLYNENIFYTKIVKEPKKHYLSFHISIVEGLLKFGILKINTIEKTVYIGNTLIFGNGKTYVGDREVRKGVYILYAVLKVGKRLDKSITISDTDIDKFKIEFENAKIILGGNSKVTFESFINSELTKGTNLLKKHGEKYFKVDDRNGGQSSIHLLKT